MVYKALRFRANERLALAGESAPVMQKGEMGQAVRLVQQALIDLNYPLPKSTKSGSPDGHYGKETKAAVWQFQLDKKTKYKDGIVGAEVMAKFDDLLYDKPWTPLPDIGGAGGADNPAGNAHQAILEALGSGYMAMVNFGLHFDPVNGGAQDCYISGHRYQDIAVAVDQDRITVEYHPGLAVSALYDPANNLFKIGRPIGSTFNDRCLIVHEATHAICDLQGNGMNALFSEMVAFIAEAYYSRLVKGGPKVSGDSAAGEVYGAADEIVGLLRKGKSAPNDLLTDFGLKIRSYPAYADFTYGTVQYNGVPG